VIDWDDPGVDWAAHALAVVRSPWDYTRRHAEFLAWSERVARATILENPPHLLRWSADKRYLRDLAAAGVPVVPTSFAAPGETMDWPADGEIVVKPTVSAGSLDTARHLAAARAEAEAHVARLHAGGREAMAQPYLSRVEGERGETALVFIDGAFSHAARKGPMLVPGLSVVGGLFVEEDIRPAAPTTAEMDVAAAALAAIPGGRRPLYARVDLVPDDAGRPVVLELELVEPSLFLVHGAGAAERVVDAIAARLTARSSAPG
jgi:glutathione synthase/RimK-type ligase-like ATP-grasp enzyme